MFRRVLGQVDLQQDFWPPAFVDGNRFDAIQQFQAVDRVHDRCGGQSATHLVALQLSEQVPLDVRGKVAGTLFQLLWPAFAEDGLSAFEQAFDPFRPRVLGDTDQLHILGVTSNAIAGNGNPLPDSVEILCNLL